jgi:hypothetical protein
LAEAISSPKAFDDLHRQRGLEVRLLEEMLSGSQAVLEFETSIGGK